MCSSSGSSPPLLMSPPVHSELPTTTSGTFELAAMAAQCLLLKIVPRHCLDIQAYVGILVLEQALQLLHGLRRGGECPERHHHRAGRRYRTRRSSPAPISAGTQRMNSRTSIGRERLNTSAARPSLPASGMHAFPGMSPCLVPDTLRARPTLSATLFHRWKSCRQQKSDVHRVVKRGAFPRETLIRARSPATMMCTAHVRSVLDSCGMTR